MVHLPTLLEFSVCVGTFMFRVHAIKNLFTISSISKNVCIKNQQPTASGANIVSCIVSGFGNAHASRHFTPMKVYRIFGSAHHTHAPKITDFFYGKCRATAVYDERKEQTP